MAVDYGKLNLARVSFSALRIFMITDRRSREHCGNQRLLVIYFFHSSPSSVDTCGFRRQHWARLTEERQYASLTYLPAWISDADQKSSVHLLKLHSRSTARELGTRRDSVSVSGQSLWEENWSNKCLAMFQDHRWDLWMNWIIKSLRI